MEKNGIKPYVMLDKAKLYYKKECLAEVSVKLALYVGDTLNIYIKLEPEMINMDMYIEESEVE